MVRKNIFELMNNSYNVSNEITKIVDLFNKDLFAFKPYGQHSTHQINCNIENIFDSKILPIWKQRSSFLSCEEIKEVLNIKQYISAQASIEKVITYLEYYENLIYLITQKLNIFHNNNYVVSNHFLLLIENIKNLLEHINYEHFIYGKEEQVILIPKMPEATAVAEISTDETAFAILKYNHASLKGDLKEKRNLLSQIAREYETVLNNPIEGYSEFFKQTNRLLNTLHIRHNNKEKIDNKNQIIDIKDHELEKWYDETYQLLLFCILIKDNLERKNNAKEFLKTLIETKT